MIRNRNGSLFMFKAQCIFLFHVYIYTECERNNLDKYYLFNTYANNSIFI